MVTDKFIPGDSKRPEIPKPVDVPEKGQDVIKAQKKEVKFTSHTIKQGETLSEICQQYGIPLKALYAVNQHELDPKIMEKVSKDGTKTIAYGAPTYHVGDKLNIPSNADVPNAVKYFDQWAKAVVAKQRLEKPTLGPEQKSGTPKEQTPSRTQILDDEHLAARSAALMVRVASETKYNQFRTQHEGQGGVDDAWDWMKTTLKIGDSSQEIERDFANQRGMVKVLEKAAKNQDLTQFKQLYQQCTGKAFDAKNFSTSYKKPASLAFPDLANQYEQSQETGRKGARVALAAGVASLAVIPGAAPLAIEGAYGILATTATATAYGTMGGMLGDYANSGDITKTGQGAKEGAIVGASIGIASTLGIGAQGRLATTLGEKTVLAQVTASGLSNAVTGGVAGAGIGGGLTAENDLRTTGKVDGDKVFNASVHGLWLGAATGGAMGVTGPLAEGAIAARAAGQAAARETTPELAAATTETTPAVASEAAVVSKSTSQAFNKTSELPPEVPGKGTTQPQTDVIKPTQTDVSKGTTQPPTDLSRTTTQDVSKGTAPPNADAAKTIQGDWSKANLPPLQKKTGDLSTPKADTDLPKTSQTPDDVRQSSTSDWTKGDTMNTPPAEKPGADVPKTDVQKQSPPSLTDSSKAAAKPATQPSVDEAWQTKLGKLSHDPLVKDVKPLELQGGWKGVQYERTIGGRQVREMYNPKDGSKVFWEEYKDGMGVPHREITTVKDGNMIKNRIKQTINSEGKEQWVEAPNVDFPKVSEAWGKKMSSLRDDPRNSNIKESPKSNGWNKVSYERSNGARKIEESVRESDGARYYSEEYIDGQGVPNKEITITASDGHSSTTRYRQGPNSTSEKPDWQYVSKNSTRPQLEKAGPPAPSPNDQGVHWYQEMRRNLSKDPNISNVKEVPYTKGARAIEYNTADGKHIEEVFNPYTGSKKTTIEYAEGNDRFQELTLDTPAENIHLWSKNKWTTDIRGSRWETIDSTHQQNLKAAQDAINKAAEDAENALKSPTE